MRIAPHHLLRLLYIILLFSASLVVSIAIIPLVVPRDRSPFGAPPPSSVTTHLTRPFLIAESGASTTSDDTSGGVACERESRHAYRRRGAQQGEDDGGWWSLVVSLLYGPTRWKDPAIYSATPTWDDYVSRARSQAPSFDDVGVAIVSHRFQDTVRVACQQRTFLRAFPHHVVLSDRDVPERSIQKISGCPFRANKSSGQRKMEFAPLDLWRAFPNKRFYLILDDDVVLQPKGVLELLWETEKAMIDVGTDVWLSGELWGVVYGGTYMFSGTAMRELVRHGTILSCNFDLEDRRRRHIEFYPGVEPHAPYNGDHILSYCVESRLGGFLFDNKERVIYDLPATGFDIYGGDRLPRNVVAVHHIKDLAAMEILWSQFSGESVSCTDEVMIKPKR